MEYRNHHGEMFTPHTMMEDGMTCRFCQRVIRVRERCGYFMNPSALSQYECRDCLYDAPVTDFNREWRERERKRADGNARPSRASSPPRGRYDLND